MRWRGAIVAGVVAGTLAGGALGALVAWLYAGDGAGIQEAYHQSWKRIACTVEVAPPSPNAPCVVVSTSPAYRMAFVRTPDGRLWRVQEGADYGGE